MKLLKGYKNCNHYETKSYKSAKLYLFFSRDS